MVIFDELAFATSMDKTGFQKRFSTYELSIYARWLSYKGFSTEEIEAALISFSKTYYPDFLYDVHYPCIDKALASTSLYRLRIPFPVPITEKEWRAILSVNPISYQKILFIMLVLGKFYRLNPVQIKAAKRSESEAICYCNLQETEITGLARASFPSKAARLLMWQELCEKGLIDVAEGKKNAFIVRFADFSHESPVLEQVKDFDHLILYYERLKGEKIGECQHKNQGSKEPCGKLFQKKSGSAKYCDQHRGYQPSLTKKVVCPDCGREFIVSSKATKARLCSLCKSKKLAI